MGHVKVIRPEQSPTITKDFSKATFLWTFCLPLRLNHCLCPLSSKPDIIYTIASSVPHKTMYFTIYVLEIVLFKLLVVQFHAVHFYESQPGCNWNTIFWIKKKNMSLCLNFLRPCRMSWSYSCWFGPVQSQSFIISNMCVVRF